MLSLKMKYPIYPSSESDYISQYFAYQYQKYH
nr:MAG TPA: hypothetical protein [Bacteriophage sp.]